MEEVIKHIENEAEQVAMAKAKAANAQGNYDAGLLDVKTKKQ